MFYGLARVKMKEQPVEETLLEGKTWGIVPDEAE